MDKKLLAFLIIFFALFFAYQKFVIDPMVKKQPEPVTAPAAATPAEKSTTPAPSSTEAPAEKSPDTTAVVPEETTAPAPSGETRERAAVVETPLYRAELSNRGAVLTSFRLKKYTDDFNGSLEMVPQGKEVSGFPLTLDFEDKQVNALSSGLYSMSRESLNLGGSDEGSIEFERTDGGHTFRKKITFHADSYLLSLKIDALKGSEAIPARVLWTPGIETADSYRDLSGLPPSEGLVHNGEKVVRKKGKDIEEFTKVGATVKWAGVDDNYFAAIFIPSGPADAFMYPPADPKKKPVDIAVSLAPQRNASLDFKVFIGPKDFNMLRGLGMDLEKAVDFGFFLGPIIKGLLFALRALYSFTHNYGWAILLLTVIIKIVFTPFMQKSFASQKKMQAMQPEMKKVQEKYAKMKNDDPRKQNMNTEIMALHKRYGVNPLGGCLPMLIQMPVLFAFYQLLSRAIELRKAPFMFWITDLSRPDPLYITPVLMGASMLIQQRLTPISDPMQKNMMYIMPVMFTFMSFKLQSGLVLYWLLSNLLGLLHQYIFTRYQNRAVAVVKEGNA